MPGKRLTGAPVAVQLHLTRNCNLNCIHCSANKFREKETEEELNTIEWVNLLKRLKEIQVFDIAFSGGEVFLRKDIFEILETAVKCNFPKMRLTSNGTLIDEAISKQLRLLNFKNIAISLEGNMETHDQVRGAGSFSRAIEGIRYLVTNGIFPAIRFTPIKSNYERLSEIVDILYPMGIRKIVLNSLKATGSCKEIYKDIMLNFLVDVEKFQEIISGLRMRYGDLKINDIEAFYKDLPMQYLKNSSSRSLNGQKLKPCSAAHSSCNITSGGWIIPCSELFDFKGGNIREQDIIDVWQNSEAFKKIRRLSNISTAEIPYCRNCDFNVSCNAGCRANAYAIYGDLLAPDPFCPFQPILPTRGRFSVYSPQAQNLRLRCSQK